MNFKTQTRHMSTYGMFKLYSKSYMLYMLIVEISYGRYVPTYILNMKIYR